MSNKIIQNIFNTFADYLDTTPQPLKNRKAIRAIQDCRTEAMGKSVYYCDDNHDAITQFHSCRHRSCYVCSERRRAQWIDAQRKRLFDIPHFHVVFTLPHDYLSLWRFNETLFTRLIFQASKETLLELIGDKAHHGVTPGILMALHTWGRKQDLHPHTHCLVTSGGLDGKGHWHDIGDYLLPSRVLKAKYRGKFKSLLRDAFQDGELGLPPDMDTQLFWRLYRAVYKKSWCVRIEERYAHGKGVMLYLARYLKGGPLNPKQIVSAAEDAITFRYLDHRDKRVKTLRLSYKEFLRRFLSHVPAMGKHTVHFYGLYATCNRAKHDACAAKHGTLSDQPSNAGLHAGDVVLFCSTCGAEAKHRYRVWPRRQKGNSINREHPRRDCACGSVQQVNQPDGARDSLFSSA